MSRLRRSTFLLVAAALLVVSGARSAASSAAEPSAADLVLASLALALEDHFRPSGSLELSLARYHHQLDATIIAAELMSPPQTLASQMVLRIATITAAGEREERSLVVQAKLWAEGWVLREPASLRTPLSRRDVEPQRYDALRSADALQFDDGAELDYARNLPGGRLLTWRDVVRRPLVRRNEAVEVTASDGLLTVTLRAIALQDAARGEAVRVRNPDTRKEFVATVSNPAQATVHF